jgi:hypothetical protein
MREDGRNFMPSDGVRPGFQKSPDLDFVDGGPPLGASEDMLRPPFASVQETGLYCCRPQFRRLIRDLAPLNQIIPKWLIRRFRRAQRVLYRKLPHVASSGSAAIKD